MGSDQKRGICYLAAREHAGRIVICSDLIGKLGLAYSNQHVTKLLSGLHMRIRALVTERRQRSLSRAQTDFGQTRIEHREISPILALQ